MKFLYPLIVFFVSIEAIILAGAIFIFLNFNLELKSMVDASAINGDFAKYLMAIPIGLAVWVANECRLLLQEDRQTIQLLTEWDGYSRMKVHVYVSVLYAVIFATISLIPWVTALGVSTAAGILSIATSIVGQLALAGSVYFARIRSKEILSKV